jgi:response regulator RpfG family c-di-GMP phosphodiesterase
METTVLFVDDEENILHSLRRLFRNEPLRVLQASSGEEALGLLRDDDVAVLVSDNRMPGMGGIELLARAGGVSPDTVKILLTGYADLNTALAAINRGEVFRFVTKPWEDGELKRAVAEAVERHRLARALRDADEGKLLSLAQAIELKDAYTRGHCDRVALYALRIAEGLALGEDVKRQLRYGSWLHDCGKIGVPEGILNKNGALTAEEFAVVRNHPAWGAEVAGHARVSRVVANVIRHHHEKVDGTGYPDGLRGEQIPLEARIVAVADVFDALTSDRPYRAGFPWPKAAAILRSMAGDHLDPQLVEILLQTAQPGA